jgi:Na+/proline symporter
MGWDVITSFWVAAIVVIVYTSVGGYLAVVLTDFVQFW